MDSLDNRGPNGEGQARGQARNARGNLSMVYKLRQNDSWHVRGVASAWFCELGFTSNVV
jgi:hypothetical protein